MTHVRGIATSQPPFDLLLPPPADQQLPRHRALPLTLMRLFGNKKLRLHSSVP